MLAGSGAIPVVDMGSTDLGTLLVIKSSYVRWDGMIAVVKWRELSW